MEMRKLQQQMTVLCTQQEQHEEKVEELQAEVERVTCITQHVHQKVHDAVASVDKFMPKQVSFNLVK